MHVRDIHNQTDSRDRLGGRADVVVKSSCRGSRRGAGRRPAVRGCPRWAGGAGPPPPRSGTGVSAGDPRPPREVADGTPGAPSPSKAFRSTTLSLTGTAAAHTTKFAGHYKDVRRNEEMERRRRLRENNKRARLVHSHRLERLHARQGDQPYADMVLGSDFGPGAARRRRSSCSVAPRSLMQDSLSASTR